MVYSGFVVVTRDAFGEYEPCNPCQGKMGHNNSGDFVPCPDGVANGTFICSTYGGGDGPPPPEACDGGFDIWYIAVLPRLLLRLVVALHHRLLSLSQPFFVGTQNDRRLCFDLFYLTLHLYCAACVSRHEDCLNGTVYKTLTGLKPSEAEAACCSACSADNMTCAGYVCECFLSACQPCGETHHACSFQRLSNNSNSSLFYQNSNGLLVHLHIFV